MNSVLSIARYALWLHSILHALSSLNLTILENHFLFLNPHKLRKFKFYFRRASVCFNNAGSNGSMIYINVSIQKFLTVRRGLGQNGNFFRVTVPYCKIYLFFLRTSKLSRFLVTSYVLRLPVCIFTFLDKNSVLPS